MDCWGFQDSCHEAFDFVMRVEDGCDGLFAFFGEFVDSFALYP